MNDQGRKEIMVKSSFKSIVGYEGLYSVSDTGQVFSERSKRILTPALDKYGYYYYILSTNGKKKTIKAHRIVAEAFIENPDGKPTVDHINGIKTDNRVENLRWATRKEQSNNPITYRKLASRDSAEKLREMGQKRNFGRKPVKVFKNEEIVGVFSSLLSAADSVGVNYAKASECANGKRRKTGGYSFLWA